MRLMAAGLALALSGCSTVGGWFGSGPAKAKPAELVEFKPSASLVEAWKGDTGDSSGHLFHPQADGDDVFAAGGSRVVRIAVATGKPCGKPTPA
jgi:outer membrane protein assembly factor BamB